MRFDKEDFENKCNGALDDIENNKLTSPTWLIMGTGAIVGLVMSCLRLKRKTSKPILARFTETKGEE